MMLIALIVTVSVQAQAATMDDGVYDIKITGTEADGSYKWNFLMVEGYSQMAGQYVAFTVEYGKGWVEFYDDVEEVYIDYEGSQAIAWFVLGWEDYAEFLSYGKAKKGTVQTKGVGLMPETEFAPYFTFQLRENSKLGKLIDSSELEYALSAYLAKKSKLPETFVLQELQDFLSFYFGDI